ncbi:DNA-binding protein [Enterococcus faecium]|uniref:Bacterial peptidase A24 protein n=1 Tax=Enterococcus faecium R496 TaxID=1134836 RepID=A0AAV3GTZ8_ENTFC|nr:bacterial peptidase A24 protein [Enterococcus faecium R496]EJX72163.1 bacterial peptidase A24 protein [Enterococcus faecium P1140]EJX94131.1 bacterial peptidase A24 protein [Enterococcus faecium ERV168]EJX98912.1 bacterial peptidase A24 protein [Enterococcus faecium ERV165]EJY00427.1 bacterial peptidase A24 protein [Enterococcus faecium ERV102]EJY20907.1 bacterial peptidase A24 protein [Enterococcus faecium C621]EOG20785.1 peptidase A24 [Enterococcus faecium EnGen0179]KAB2118237.1 DNA-bin
MLLYFIIGCCIGSFLCLTAQRIPLGHSIIYPRSHCVKCCRSLSWYELIPILSIIVQRFRCRYCRCRLPFYYLLAEALCGGLFAWFFTFSSARNFSTFIWMLSALLFSLMDLFYFMVHSHTLFCSWAILWIFWLQAGVFQWQSVAVNVYRRRCVPSLWSILSRSWRYSVDAFLEWWLVSRRVASDLVSC